MNRVLATLSGIFFLALCVYWGRIVPTLVDAQVYAKALNTFYHGGNPYLEDSNFRFVYPPLFLLIPNLGHAGWYAYLGVNIICLLSVPYLIAKYLSGTWVNPIWTYLVFAFVPAFAAEMALLSGNLANIFYAALLYTGLRGVRHGKWTPFYMSILVAGSIKPPFLAFLLLPVLMTARWIPATLTVTAVGSLFTIQRVTVPLLFKGFKDAIRSQLATHGDMGMGIPALFHGASMSIVLHFGLVCAFFVYMWHSRRYRENPVWLAGALVLCFFANPRPLNYDIAVAALPALYILSESFRKLPALSGCCMAVGLLLFSRSVGIGMFGLLFGSLIVCVLTVHQHRRLPENQRTIDRYAPIPSRTA
jgi:hypothetical protein